MLLSIIVPCYNEEENIRPFYEKVKETLPALLPHLELLFIDDGSTDKTLSQIQDLGSEVPERVRAVSFSRNFGRMDASSKLA